MYLLDSSIHLLAATNTEIPVEIDDLVSVVVDVCRSF